MCLRHHSLLYFPPFSALALMLSLSARECLLDRVADEGGFPGGLTMTSDAENEKRGELAGRADGRCWAEHTTEHDDLRKVAAIEFQPGLDCYKALCDAVDPDNEFSEMEIKRYLFGDESAVLTNEYFAAFIEGARQFFLEG